MNQQLKQCSSLDSVLLNSADKPEVKFSINDCCIDKPVSCTDKQKLTYASKHCDKKYKM